MKANTGLCLVLSGISLWLLLPGEAQGGRRRIAHLFAELVALIGAATLAEYLFGLNLRIDQLFFTEPPGAMATYSPGRMAPPVTTAFLALGLALLLLDWKTRSGTRPSQGLSLWTALVALMAISGYLYHATALYRILLYTQVALPTAITLLLLSGAIFFARPREGIAGDLTGRFLGSAMARRFLPAVLLIPLILGWIRLQGQRVGLYGTELGLALYATSNVVIFSVLVWLNARKMNKTEQSLEESRIHFSFLAEAIPQITWTARPDGWLDYYNQRWFDYTGMTLQQTQGWGWGPVLHPDDLQNSKNAWADAVKNGTPYEVEYRFKRASDGAYRWHLGRALPLRDDTGRIIKWFGTCTDIDDKKRVEASLREVQSELEIRVALRTTELHEANTRLRGLLNAATLISIIATDPAGLITLFNSGAERMLGYAADEMIGKHTPAIIHLASEVEARGQSLSEEFGRPIHGFEVFVDAVRRNDYEEREWTYVRKDGQYLIVRIVATGVRDSSGAITGFLGIATDITQRKKAESDLLLLTERLSLATEVANVGVWEWDVANNLVTSDNTMLEIYGFSPNVPMPYEKWSTPIPFDKFAAAVHPEDLPAVLAALQKVIKEKGQGSAEFRITRTDGAVRNISAAERVVLDERGNVNRLIGVNVDVTDRKQAEEALEQSRKDQLRFKDEFLSHVSHELRSPLTAIKQFTTILLGGLAGELNLEQREYQQIVLKNIKQLQSMIDDLLEVTRLETGKLSVELESVSVSDTVVEIFKTLRETARIKGLTLLYDLPRDLPAAYADYTRLRQVMIILLDNAIKYTPAGGTVKIQARLLEDSRFLLVEVSDSGCGISPELGDKIFERLYQVPGPEQASRKGLGLGLFICKELVTRQGGTIWVKSEPQKGSIFSFTLPVISLTDAIAPLLRNDKWPGESVALLMVETGFPAPHPGKETSEECSHEIRALVQRCLLPDLDVLLPKISSGEDGERLFVVAFANESGVSVLVNRIKEQFQRHPRLRETGLALSVSFNMLKPFPSDTDKSTQHIVTHLATELEESMKSQLISEVVHHE